MMRRPPPRPKQARPALSWLDREPSFAACGEQARRLMALQADLHAVAPELGLKAVALKQDVLVIGAAQAGVAAKVRQIEPRLLAALRQKGWPLKHLRMKPQFEAPPPPRVRELRPGPNASAVAALDTLAAQSGTPVLQEALRRLANRHRPKTPGR